MRPHLSLCAVALHAQSVAVCLLFGASTCVWNVYSEFWMCMVSPHQCMAACACTALWAMATRPKLAQLLSRSLPLTPRPRRDADGRTCLHYAAGYGHEECVDTLLAKGASTRAKDVNGDVPLHFASIHGHPMCAYNISKVSGWCTAHGAL